MYFPGAWVTFGIPKLLARSHCGFTLITRNALEHRVTLPMRRGKPPTKLDNPARRRSRYLWGCVRWQHAEAEFCRRQVREGMGRALRGFRGVDGRHMRFTPRRRFRADGPAAPSPA
jgi:hypothetical protein